MSGAGPARGRRILVVANPAAGRMRAGGLDRVAAALDRLGGAVAIRHAGPEPGSAERLAREAEPEFDVIAAAGGDGTVNAVLNGLAGSGRAMAVVPLGTVNLLAREIGLPRRPEALAAVIAAAPARPIWPGRVGGRLFAMVASAGIDAEIVAAVDPLLKRRFGRLAFAWPALRRWLAGGGGDLTVRTDAAEYRAAAILAARGRFYAGRFVAAPEASLAEPVLHLLLLREGGRRAVLRHAAALVRGRLADSPGVTVIRCREAAVVSAAPVPVQGDGEILGRTPVRFDIAPEPALLVMP